VTTRPAAWLADDVDPSPLLAEVERLVDFARAARHPLGFGWLDERGALTDRPVELWITCRMTHVFALETLRSSGGDTASAALAAHGVEALRGPLHDAEHGGWFAAVDVTGPVETAKQAYGHAFVVLAAASATAAGTTGAADLLADALDVLDRRFWDESHGMAVEEWDRGWQTLEGYRGVNANMHLVEALLAAHDVTGDPELLDRARRVTTRVAHELGRRHDFRLPEHFTETWEPLPDFNREDPAHPFRPYGVTVGHLLEWSRLTLLLGRALGPDAPTWVADDARSLFERAVSDGWSGGESPGFCYTTDFEGRPVVTHRMHWVVAEAVAAASVLAQDTGDPTYDAWRDAWLDLALTRFADPDGGSWWHEVDEANRPSAVVWQGKPDVYHAYQALLTPLLTSLSPASSYVASVRAAQVQ
jgi:sulfoquinovose isomerase